MAPQTKSDPATARAHNQRARRGVLGSLLYWAPAWLPAMVVAQILLYGLKPSLAEERRIDRVEKNLSMREERLERDAELQERNRRMLDDEIYQERVRKSIGISGEEPLRLQHDPSEGK